MHFHSVDGFDTADGSTYADHSSLTQQRYVPLPIASSEICVQGMTNKGKLDSSPMTSLPDVYGYNIYHGKVKHHQSVSREEGGKTRTRTLRLSGSAELTKFNAHAKHATAGASSHDLFSDSRQQSENNEMAAYRHPVDHKEHGKHGRRHNDEEWMYCLDQLRHEHGK